MKDLWGSKNQAQKGPQSSANSEEIKKPAKDMQIKVSDGTIRILSQVDLALHSDYESLLGVVRKSSDERYLFTIPLRAINAFVLRYMLKGYIIAITPADAKVLGFEANKIKMPKAVLSEDLKTIEVTIPPIGLYKEMVRYVNGYPIKSGGYRISITRIEDYKALVGMMESSLPPVDFEKKVHDVLYAPIKEFDGTLESLKTVPIGVLNVVKANSQSYKSLSKSNKSLEEKMKAFGLETLYDLVMWLPKRYIDKSKPQDLRDLVIDEQSTVLGTIESVEDVYGQSGFAGRPMGIAFVIKTSLGDSIRVTFWRQHWLKTKFMPGQEVIVTGKFFIWNKRRQLNGTSIESAQTASVLPIVPVYKQSESRGITTSFILAAVRELFNRIESISLPAYLDKPTREGYYDFFKELHLPSDLAKHKRAINTLAYYELVYMQLLIQDQRQASRRNPGIPQPKTSFNLQEKAINSLPFTLTNSQKRAVKEMNEKLADAVPSNTLLNAEVGSGKTIIAQLSCLRSVEAGYQAVLVGPTDILARQLHATFKKLVDTLNSQGENIRLEFLGSGQKAAEKRKLLKEIASGEVDIVVGTHSVFSKGVNYFNLGFVAIDEQQKFGAEQRSHLLNSRSDRRVPDLLMQTATPIPRSTAQVFYGDVDMILLNEKPPGRLPIVTKWIREDPLELFGQMVNPLWTDIENEAAKGNQTFVITPLVRESPKVDAASVERTFKELTKILSGLKVAYVHGQMKNEEQKQTMEDFRAKKYDILVASTVVEVGVDVPDATRMVVMSADRLGASSLHQIRGRVGRNSKPSVCYLVSLGSNDNSTMRLQSLVDNENGFEVAKVDLVIRGEGTMFGSDQSGASEMVFASLASHGKLVNMAKDEAIAILNGPYRDIALEDSRKKFNAEGRLV